MKNDKEQPETVEQAAEQKAFSLKGKDLHNEREHLIYMDAFKTGAAYASQHSYTEAKLRQILTDLNKLGYKIVKQ